MGKGRRELALIVGDDEGRMKDFGFETIDAKTYFSTWPVSRRPRVDVILVSEGDESIASPLDEGLYEVMPDAPVVLRCAPDAERWLHPAAAVWCDDSTTCKTAIERGHHWRNCTATTATIRNARGFVRDAFAWRPNVTDRTHGTVRGWDFRRDPVNATKRVLVVGGFGGPYGAISRAWMRAWRRLGYACLVGVGNASEIDAFQPDLIQTVYMRSAFRRSRDFWRLVDTYGIPHVAMSYEDPYETIPMSRAINAVGAHLVLTTEPQVLPRGDYPNAYYLPHLYDPALIPNQAEIDRAGDTLRKIGHRGQFDAATIGHCYAGRFVWASKHAHLFSRHRWLTIGKDWGVFNTKRCGGEVLRPMPMRTALAFAANARYFVNLHRDATTAHERWRAPVHPTNINWTAVMVSAMGRPTQVIDPRPCGALMTNALSFGSAEELSMILARDPGGFMPQEHYAFADVASAIAGKVGLDPDYQMRPWQAFDDLPAALTEAPAGPLPEAEFRRGVKC